ncbi:hypothetical protein MHY29_11605 [Micrococcus sp. ACRRV]|uniref:hypothetical protein n=1 Tax=Micrococcus sp. ACRRV TaxID=2918203 RepID=UPI001EF32628|nr:hypothetical protein [Micrococcus sp. ACRRV]MCG7423452.1 hypothetical protein [Micrococcus sp. ACRRV]
MPNEVLLVAGVGAALFVLWAVGGWLIVRMGFTRDRDRLPDGPGPASALPDGDGAPSPGRLPADPAQDPHAAWREQMKAATVASGARCTCEDGAVPDPDCPVHRWDYA